MKPKERRDRLFKTSRPNIKEMKLIDENGYTQDMKVLWGAYKQSNPEKIISQEDFAETIMNEVDPYHKKWLIEDNNTFCGGYGPVGMIWANYDGWGLEPQFELFNWATPRNVLRAMVSFLQMMRYDKDIGIVNVHSQKDNRKLFNHVEKYGVLKFATKIPDGDENGDKYIYYIRGRK